MKHSSTKFLELLSPKTYTPPPNTKAREAQLTSSSPLIDAPVDDQIMPNEDMIQAQVIARTRRSSSTASSASNITSNHDSDRNLFLPLAELKE